MCVSNSLHTIQTTRQLQTLTFNKVPTTKSHCHHFFKFYVCVSKADSRRLDTSVNLNDVYLLIYELVQGIFALSRHL